MRRKKEYPEAIDFSVLTPRAAEAFRLFNLCSTQWRTSFGGDRGLDYPACHLVAELSHIDFAWTFPLLQALERARLKHFSDKAEREEAARKGSK